MTNFALLILNQHNINQDILEYLKTHILIVLLTLNTLLLNLSNNDMKKLYFFENMPFLTYNIFVVKCLHLHNITKFVND